MSHARTVWEEGHEPGRRVVVLGVALTLSLACIDLFIGDRVGVVFDLGFVVVCVLLALLVDAIDFFVVGVLPPLLMVALFILLAITQPATIALPDDGVVQAVVSGLGHHSISLFVGYGLCLGCLAMRRHVLAGRAAAERAAAAPAYSRTEPDDALSV
ncbi:MAG: hypothetical protein QM638_17350 [Nocardioides sp.]|uniref:DUF6542 domain-containing protein n=1 Tax=Nocardioides sp. TaxID=35761 RepID=UPI0039E6D16D